MPLHGLVTVASNNNTGRDASLDERLQHATQHAYEHAPEPFTLTCSGL